MEKRRRLTETMATFQITNKLDLKTYLVAITKADKFITVSFYSESRWGGRIDERNHVVCQAAVYAGVKASYKPLFMMDLTDKVITGVSGSETVHKSKSVAPEAFTDFIKTILANERVDDLAAGSEKVYSKYGFWPNHCSIWSLFTLGSVDHVFVNQKEETPVPDF